ncbi:Ras-related protein Rab-11B [Planoprotostelium fungivorum]|uniref:Ras-related protein Rab-11B n=1 Tax=Planoprotostelium fungivorum TaxID=1890364 RepID=A0A2P6MRR6_9EUKA|nr:Ras-related protein Rab-11B [Planoprotostelium fungivorum]
MSDDESATMYKVLVTGDSSVGKTNIISRFTSNEFALENKATIGVEFGHAEVTVSDGTEVKVQIWDTAGQERFRAITRGYYRGAHAALIVFDITKAATFKNVPKWLSELHEHADKDITVMLVGNKSDLKTNREVATEEAKKYAQQNSLLYIETSALDGENISEAFNTTIDTMHKKLKPDPSKGEKKAEANISSGVTIKPTISEPATPQKGGCC